MSLILRSDTVASNFISDLAGIKNVNYFLAADFVNQSYELNGSAVEFQEIFDYSRPEAYVLEEGKLKLVDANVPIFHDPNNERRGLWMQYNGAVNALGPGEQKTTKTLTIHPSNIGTIRSLQVFGSGSVTVSGDITLNEGGATASKDHPILFTPIGAGVVTFTVSGDVQYYQTQQRSARELFQPLPVHSPVDSLKIKNSVIANISGAPFVFIIRVRPYFIGGRPTFRTAFVEVDAANLATGYFNEMNGMAAMRLRNGDISAGATAEISDYILDVSFVVNFGQDGSLAVYRRGEKIAQTEANPADLLQQIIFGTSTKYPSVGRTFTGLLKNFALYKVELNDEQLMSLSASFKS